MIDIGRIILQTFQFTHPGRGATDLRLLALAGLMFQFTHPGRGATGRYVDCFSLMASFNSRTPGGVRLAETPTQPHFCRFQFTHPGRGATPSRGRSAFEGCVSIHAPREGCDKKSVTSRRSW